MSLTLTWKTEIWTNCQGALLPLNLNWVGA
jgi:hypothetical protein